MECQEGKDIQIDIFNHTVPLPLIINNQKIAFRLSFHSYQVPNFEKSKGIVNSPLRNIAPYGAILRIFKMAFYRLFQVRLGYIGDCPTGLGKWPCWGQKKEKSYCEKYEESPHKVRCYERDYTQKKIIPFFHL